MEEQHAFSPDSPEIQASRPTSSRTDRRYRNDKRHDLPPFGPVDIVALVRSLQRTAGLNDCFKRGDLNCTVRDCAWRTHCLGPSDI